MTAQSKRVALCGLLLALMLVLGYVESLLPAVSGVPGIKLGLSNGVLIFAVYMLNVPTAFVLMGLKVALSGLLFGGVSAMIYAAAGGVLSLTVMCLLSRVRGLHPVVVSMAGGVFHNVGQLGMAMLILQTPSLAYYLAVLMLSGLATGAVTGVAASSVMKHVKSIRHT
ncbi:MAG: Gx transporter family protein [Clostridiales bacterium]|nr:Gx transporter family protein [Clostridiales bacterium]